MAPRTHSCRRGAWPSAGRSLSAAAGCRTEPGLERAEPRGAPAAGPRRAAAAAVLGAVVQRPAEPCPAEPRGAGARLT